MRRIADLNDVTAALDALCHADPRLAPVRAAAGDVPLRLTQPGFASLLSIVISQQVSRASADAISGRFLRLVDPLTPRAVLEADDRIYRQAGFSRPKQRAALSVARAVLDGLDLMQLCDADADHAMAQLTAVSGIGPWTAEVYLLFAAGHPDVFPAGDVALQSAVAHGLGLPARPGGKALARIAESWSPWRGSAARLFWAYYRGMRGRDAAPLGQAAEETQES